MWPAAMHIMWLPGADVWWQSVGLVLWLPVPQVTEHKKTWAVFDAHHHWLHITSCLHWCKQRWPPPPPPVEDYILPIFSSAYINEHNILQKRIRATCEKFEFEFFCPKQICFPLRLEVWFYFLKPSVLTLIFFCGFIISAISGWIKFWLLPKSIF